MHQFIILLFASALEANLEAARLEVRAVRRAGDLAVLAGITPTGHPGFEIEFPISGSS